MTKHAARLHEPLPPRQQRDTDPSPVGNICLTYSGPISPSTFQRQDRQLQTCTMPDCQTNDHEQKNITDEKAADIAHTGLLYLQTKVRIPAIMVDTTKHPGRRCCQSATFSRAAQRSVSRANAGSSSGAVPPALWSIQHLRGWPRRSNRIVWVLKAQEACAKLATCFSNTRNTNTSKQARRTTDLMPSQ